MPNYILNGHRSVTMACHISAPDEEAAMAYVNNHMSEDAFEETHSEWDYEGMEETDATYASVVVDNDGNPISPKP